MWLYIGIGIGAVVTLLCCIGTYFLCSGIRERKFRAALGENVNRGDAHVIEYRAGGLDSPPVLIRVALIRMYLHPLWYRIRTFVVRDGKEAEELAEGRISVAGDYHATACLVAINAANSLEMRLTGDPVYRGSSIVEDDPDTIGNLPEFQFSSQVPPRRTIMCSSVAELVLTVCSRGRLQVQVYPSWDTKEVWGLTECVRNAATEAGFICIQVGNFLAFEGPAHLSCKWLAEWSDKVIVDVDVTLRLAAA